MFMKPEWVAPTEKLSFIGSILFQLVVCLTKLGMCLSYLRIFEDRRSRVLLNLIMAFLTASGITTVLLIVFSCSPVAALWMPQLGSYMKAGPNVVTSAVCNTAADIMLMAFAIPRVHAYNRNECPNPCPYTLTRLCSGFATAFETKRFSFDSCEPWGSGHSCLHRPMQSQHHSSVKSRPYL
jgi:hypothetical protein